MTVTGTSPMRSGLPTMSPVGKKTLAASRAEDGDRRAGGEVVAREAAPLLDLIAVHGDVVGADAVDVALLVGELRAHPRPRVFLHAGGVDRLGRVGSCLAFGGVLEAQAEVGDLQSARRARRRRCRWAAR